MKCSVFSELASLIVQKLKRKKIEKNLHHEFFSAKEGNIVFLCLCSFFKKFCVSHHLFLVFFFENKA